MPNAKNIILVVEDEQRLSQLLKEYLNAAGYEVFCLYRADEVIPWLSKHQATLIILDIMLPGGDGMQLCQDIRQQSSIPIIMSTARVEEAARLQGLEIGADDYVCKPYSLREMVARVKVILRRLETHNTSVLSDTPALLAIDKAKMKIYVLGNTPELTRVEFRLLEHFIENPNVVFSRDTLLNVIYDDYRFVSERTVDTHIKNVRKKIEYYLPGKQLIQSVYGVGYRFSPENPEKI